MGGDGRVHPLASLRLADARLRLSSGWPERSGGIRRADRRCRLQRVLARSLLKYADPSYTNVLKSSSRVLTFCGTISMNRVSPRLSWSMEMKKKAHFPPFTANAP